MNNLKYDIIIILLVIAVLAFAPAIMEMGFWTLFWIVFIILMIIGILCAVLDVNTGSSIKTKQIDDSFDQYKEDYEYEEDNEEEK